MKEPKKVLVYGLGLMGGSLALAIQKRFPAAKVHGVVSSLASQKKARDLGIVEEIWTEGDFYKHSGFPNYDFVIFGLPVSKLVEMLPSLPLASSTYFTDLGSTKSTIISTLDQHFSSIHNYVSSHPMCGSEESGLEHSQADLYQDKLTILTRSQNSSDEAFSFTQYFWGELGSWVLEMDPSFHDEVLAYVSHLPHIVSTLLVNTAIQNPSVYKAVTSGDRPITGGGFRDMSRIAGSNFPMWASIFTENKASVLESLKSFSRNLEEMISIFEKWENQDLNKLEEVWRAAKISKSKIRKS